jgi:ATPase subunit of ABC transporter with duplicated ATPase domains
MGNKHYVYSARTTKDGLAVLNKAKGDRGWDSFVNEAVAGHYKLDLNAIALPPSRFLAERQAAREQKAKEKAERAAKREAEKKAKKAADRKAGAAAKKTVKFIDKVAAAKVPGARATKKPAMVS